MAIVPALPGFHAALPDLQPALGISARTVDIIGDNVDCVVRGGEIVDQSPVAPHVAYVAYVAYVPNRHQSRRVRAFIDCIAEAHPWNLFLAPIPVGRRKRLAMHGKRGQGAGTPHGAPWEDEQRRPRLPGAPDGDSLLS